MKKQRHEDITEYIVGCDELTAIVTVRKSTYITKITGGQCTRVFLFVK